MQRRVAIHLALFTDQKGNSSSGPSGKPRARFCAQAARLPADLVARCGTLADAATPHACFVRIRYRQIVRRKSVPFSCACKCAHCTAACEINSTRLGPPRTD
jgi:hypothetical protein